MQTRGLNIVRLATGLGLFVALTSGAAAQLTTTPGPGGIPIAPGAPVHGYDPGGIGIGGAEIAPGPAARSVPMYRSDPAGNPVLVMPERPARRARGGGAPGVAARGGVDGDCGGAPCLPEGLRMTITASEPERAPGAAIDSMDAFHAALRACWNPPAEPRGLDMSVRLSFRRNGQLVGPPAVTYAPRGTKSDTRQAWRRNITTAIQSCAPLSFTPRFAAGIAGYPVSMRFIDDRKQR